LLEEKPPQGILTMELTKGVNQLSRLI